MNTNDIRYVLQNKLGSKIYFIGVLSSDQVASFQIPAFREKSLVFIANILKRYDRRLGHWVVFLINKSPNNKIFFYDSYGLKPSWYSKDFESFINKNADYDLYSHDRKLQSETSLFCGLYCCHFVYLCSKYEIGRVCQIIKKTFPSSNGAKNDKKIFDFYNDSLNVIPCNYWKGRKDGLVTYEQCLRN